MEDNTPIFKQPISIKNKFIGFVKCIADAMGNTNIPMASKAVTYYILLSLFPVVIIVGNLIPLLHLDRKSVVGYIEFILPKDLHSYLIPTIERVLTSSNKGILSAGIILALWAVSRGLNTAQMSMNESYGLDINSIFVEQTFLNYIIRRMLAFIMTFALMFVAVAVIIVFTFGQIFLNWIVPLLGMDPGFLEVFSTWKWPLAIVIMFLIVFALFYFLPNVRLKVHYVLLGTVIASVGMLTVSQLFSYYLKYFGAAWDNYGAIGAIIVFLLWVNMSVTIFLFGNAINVGFAEASEGSVIKNTGKLTSYLRLHEKRR